MVTRIFTTVQSIANILGKPLQRERMSKPLRFSQVVGRSTDGCELQSLRSLVV